MTWATTDCVYFRKPGAKPEETVSIVPVDEQGLELEVKGIAWHPSENRLACTAGNRLFVYDLDKLDEPLEVAAFGKDLTHFTAEPVWIDGEVYLTVFEDVKTSGAADSLPKFKKEKKKS